MTTTQRAQMATADINDLPDDQFAWIAPGGVKDASGKTVPRSNRHLPVHDKAHAANALARLPQTDIPAAAKAQALVKIKAAAKRFGVDVSDDSGAAASRAGTPYVPAKYSAGDDTARCPACGKMNDPDARFCDQCGAAMKASQPYARDSGETVQCPECGKSDDPDARFCDQCGAKLAGRTDVKVTRAARAAGEIFRYYPLDDIRVMRAADGEPSGRIVEAYATVFDEPAEIHDGQGHYTEVIDRGAFDQVLAKISRSRGGFGGAVRVLFNHGKTMEGVPAPEFQRPIGKALDIRPDGRGLLTRTEYAKKPFAEEILDDIREGRITGQSFVGGIIRSDPELRGPGDRYRGRGGALQTVRRMVLGLREYGPVLYGAYTGAEFLGVRMALPGMAGDLDLDLTEDEESAPDMDGDGTGGTPEDVTSTPRYHAHRLLALRTEEICRETGIGPLRSQW